MRPPKAFTLVELIVVMTVIALLSAVAMIDYSTSVKKARLQVATEELILLLQDGGVRAQAEPKCWVLSLSDNNSSPVLGSYSWSDGCGVPTMEEEAEDLNWVKVGISGITAQTATGETILSEAWIVFSPPDGDISVYEGGNPGPLDIQTMEVTVSYDDSDEEIFNKTVQITPVTASFVIY